MLRIAMLLIIQVETSITIAHKITMLFVRTTRQILQGILIHLQDLLRIILHPTIRSLSRAVNTIALERIIKDQITVLELTRGIIPLVTPPGATLTSVQVIQTIAIIHTPDLIVQEIITILARAILIHQDQARIHAQAQVVVVAIVIHVQAQAVVVTATPAQVQAALHVQAQVLQAVAILAQAPVLLVTQVALHVQAQAVHLQAAALAQAVLLLATAAHQEVEDNITRLI